MSLSVGQRIAGCRRALGRRRGQRLTQPTLAAKVGVSRGTIAAWEGDQQQPKGENLLRLAEVLEVSPEYLLTGRIHPFDVTGGDPHAAALTFVRLPAVEVSPEDYYDQVESQSEAISKFAGLADAAADRQYALSLLTRAGIAGAGRRTALTRKLDVLEGLRIVFSAVGGLPDWWYDVKQQVEEGKL